MKVLGIFVGRRNESAAEALLYASETELSSFSFFTRSNVLQVMKFGARLMIQRTHAGSRNALKEDMYVIYSYVRFDGLGSAVVVDAEYPSRVAFGIGETAIDSFEQACPEWKNLSADRNISSPDLKQLLEKAQDPVKVDKLLAIHADIEDVKQVTVKTIKQMLERGEKLEQLLQHSQDLQNASNLFYQSSRIGCCRSW